MKLDSDIGGLLKGVLTGCVILCLLETIAGIVVYAAGVLGLEASPKNFIGVVLGSFGGTVVAMLVFLWMAVSLQKALNAAAADGKAVRKGVQTGYASRLLAQGVWVAAAIFIPYINTICGLIPLLFPKMAIYVLQITGKLNLTQKTPSAGALAGTASQSPEKAAAMPQTTLEEAGQQSQPDAGTGSETGSGEKEVKTDL